MVEKEEEKEAEVSAADIARDAAALEAFGMLPNPLQELICVAVYVAFAQQQKEVDTSNLHAAAAAMSGPNKLEAIWRDAPPGEARELALSKAFDALPRTWRDTVTQVNNKGEKNELKVLKVESFAPLKMKVVSQGIQVELVTRVFCKGLCNLPPEAASPWRWPKNWGPVLHAGNKVGNAFNKGLLKASAAAGKNMLNLRAVVGGDRRTSMLAIGLMLDSINTLDIRDNMLSSVEVTMLGEALSRAPALNKLILAGNPIDAASATTMCNGLGENSSVQELIISRTQLGGDGRQGGSTVDIGALANVVTLNGAVRHLNLASAAMHDAAAATFISELGKPMPPLPPSKKMMLLTLNLSNNSLGPEFAKELPAALPLLPALKEVNVSKNNLGPETGGKIIQALLAHDPLRLADFSGTNLCACSPLYKPPTVTPYSTIAISALAEALPSTSITEIILMENQLCGVWIERVGGEPATRGTYTSKGMDLLSVAINKTEWPLSVNKDKVKIAGNFVRLPDEERLLAALVANSEKVVEKTTFVAEEVLVEEAEAEVMPAAEAAAEKKPTAEKPALTTDKSFKKTAEPPPDAAGTGKEQPAAAEPEAQADGTSPTEAAPAAGEGAAAAPGAAPASASPEGARPEASSAAAGTTPRSRDKPGAAPITPTAAGKTGKSPGKGGAKAGKADGKGSKADAKAEAEAEAAKADDGKPKSSGYGGYGQPKKAKKKVEKVVVEEKVSPFATSPLMVALSTLAVRKGHTHDSPLVEGCHKILPGSLVRVGGQEELSFKEKLMTKPVIETRMHIELDGDKEPLGWVTGVSRDEIETLKLAARGFPLMKATKSMVIRETQEPDSSKVGEIHKDVSVRVMETVTMDDGAEKVRARMPGQRLPPYPSLALLTGPPLGLLASPHVRMRAHVMCSAPICSARRRS